jgi:hypothetical protein
MDGVVDEVARQNAQPLGIHSDLDTGVDIHAQVDPTCVCQGTAIGARLPNGGFEGDWARCARWVGWLLPRQR